MTENVDRENKEYQKKIQQGSNFPCLFKFNQFKAFTVKSVSLQFCNDVPATFGEKKKGAYWKQTQKSNESSHRKICATLKELVISLSYECSCLCANIIFALMGCHPWTVKSLKHLCTLIYPKNLPRSSMTNPWTCTTCPDSLHHPLSMASFQWWYGIQLRTGHPACSQPHLSHLWPSRKKWPPLLSELAVWLVVHLVLKTPDRQCLGSRFWRHQTEGFWMCSNFFSFSCSPLLLQAADASSITSNSSWVIAEELKRPKSALSAPFKHDCEAAISSELR